VVVFIGISTLALFLPRFHFIFSGLSLVSLGIVLGIRGMVTSLPVFVRPGSGYGTGFWMITIGCVVLAIAWMSILAREVRAKA
jgi:hypothetical protein